MKFYDLPVKFDAQEGKKKTDFTLDELDKYDFIEGFLCERLYPGEIFPGDLIELNDIFYEVVGLAYACRSETSIEPICFVRKMYIEK